MFTISPASWAHWHMEAIQYVKYLNSYRHLILPSLTWNLAVYYRVYLHLCLMTQKICHWNFIGQTIFYNLHNQVPGLKCPPEHGYAPGRVSLQCGPADVVSISNSLQKPCHTQHTRELEAREYGGVSASLSYHETFWCIPYVDMLLSCQLHHSSVSLLSSCDQAWKQQINITLETNKKNLYTYIYIYIYQKLNTH
jgi:hypothetical protein